MAALSQIPELEHVARHGSREKRAAALQRVTSLFLEGAGSYGDEHVDLFADIFGFLIEEIESKARAELSCRLAPVPNAPIKVLRTLAHDDDIAIAGPVLKLAPGMAEADLVTLAKTKSQAHLHAISARRVLGEAVTDVLVRRGDRQVACRIADNRGARISASSFSRLVRRAAEDGILAEKIGSRADIPPPLFRELLRQASAVVHERLLVSAAPEVRAQLRDVVAKVTNEVAAHVGPRDYGAAQRLVLTLSRAGQMNEEALAAFCGDGKYEEAVASLALMAKVPINVSDRLLGGDQPDPVLILCKAAGVGWPTVRAILLLRPRRKGTSSHGLDEAFGNYNRLSPVTAQRVVRFWRMQRDG